MILTEKEAEGKACCDGGYGAVVRADDEGKYNCIASKCMAWRWIEDTCTPDGEGWKGYCGLAGEPESTT